MADSTVADLEDIYILTSTAVQNDYVRNYSSIFCLLDDVRFETHYADHPIDYVCLDCGNIAKERWFCTLCYGLVRPLEVWSCVNCNAFQFGWCGFLCYNDECSFNGVVGKPFLIVQIMDERSDDKIVFDFVGYQPGFTDALF